MQFKLATLTLTLLIIGLLSNLGHTATSVRVYSFGRITYPAISSYENVTIYEGDLIINGTQTFLIENCTYLQKGNIIVEEYGKLIVRNAKLLNEMEYLHEFFLVVQGHGFVGFEKAEFQSQGGGGPATIVVSAKGEANISSSVLEQLRGSGNSLVSVHESIIEGELRISDASTILVSESQILGDVGLRFDSSSSINIDGLEPGYLGCWSLHQNETVSSAAYDLTFNKSHVKGWELSVQDGSKVAVSNSSIDRFNICFQDASLDIHQLKSGLNQVWSYKSIVLTSTWIERWDICLIDTAATFSDSEIAILGLVNSECRLVNSEIYDDFLGGSGSINFEGVVWTARAYLIESELQLSGDVDFRRVPFIQWFSSNVTRNYNIITRDKNDDPIENVELTLLDQNNTVVWNRIADSSGVTFLNLTYSDDNHTDTLRLKTFKEGFYNATEPVSFLSNTPISINLTEKPIGDINEDRVVNILDVFIVARAFGAKPEDPNWNISADLDMNGVIDILDVFAVARDYGRSV